MNLRDAARLTLACVVVCLIAPLAAAAPGGAPPRASTAAPPQTFNLSDFGAVGNGVTDDGPALQAALDAVIAAGGGTLLVPAGRFAIVTPVVATATGPNVSLEIRGVESSTPVPPPTAGGDMLSRGLDLTSEFAPKTGAQQIAILVQGFSHFLIQDICFIGSIDVDNDALSTLAISYVPDAVIRHCEFYGLMSQSPGGSIVQSFGGGLTIQQTKFLGCTGNSGISVPVVQNYFWKSITVEDTIFIDYGQRPELYAKTGYGAPYSWVHVGPAAPPTADLPRREVVLRNLFLDEGGWLGISVLPAQFQSNPVPVDLFYATGFYVNVSNFFTTGLYISGVRQAMVEDSRFTWTHRANAALEIYGPQDAILDRIRTDAGATRLQADSLTQRLTVIDSIYSDLASSAVQTIVLTPATPDDDPVRYVRARFESALGRAPDAAAHYYWSRKLLDCGADATCVVAQRAALAAYLATTPAPTFDINGRATGEGDQPLAGVGVTLTGTHLAATLTTLTGADGSYSFNRLPTSGVYTFKVGTRRHYTFATPTRTVTTPAGAQVVNFPATLNRYAVGGRLLDERGRPIQGATLTLSGAQAATTSSDVNGNYTFASLPAGGNYTVNASSTRHTFASPSQTFTDLDANKTANFNATSLFYNVNGQVVDSANKPLAGQSVALSGGKTATATTDVQGNFTFVDLPRGGAYTVTPAKLLGSLFTPAAKSFENLTADQTAVFIAVKTDYKIAGRVTSAGTGLAGVTLTLTGSKQATTTTDANGAYSFSVPVHGDYAVAPSKTHYAFDRVSATFGGVTSDKTADFVATINRHKLSGVVKRPAGAALSGVTVTLSGAQAATATTDAQGAYSFANLPAGAAYTVTPSKPGYDLAPASQSFTDLGADRTADFSVTPSNVALAGRITVDGAALAGVTVALTGSKTGAATTDAQGRYSFNVTSEGTYTVAPSKTHYKFAPSALTFNDPISAQTADFAGTLDRHKISGRVTDGQNNAVAGVGVTLSGAQAAATTTDANGNYAFTNLPAGGNYTLTAARTNYSLAPSGIAVSDLGADQTADFVATLNRHRISGTARSPAGVALSGVTVTLSGGQAAVTTTDAQGIYAFPNLPAGGNYVVTAARVNYSLSPVSVPFNDLGADQTADFTGTLLDYVVRGRVTAAGGAALAGVTVTLSGSKAGTATTDANGGYSFTVPAEGSYTVTPSRKHYTFAPTSSTFTNLGGDKTADFDATLDRHTVSGRIADQSGAGVQGVTVTLSGSQSGTATTDAQGNFSFPNLPAGGSYTLTAAKANYTFAPQARSFDDLSSAQTADFEATLNRHAVSGRVAYANGAGIQGVTVTLSGGQAATATTDAQGAYSFANLPAGAAYTVTPALVHHTFAPASQSFDDLGADARAAFTAAVVNYRIAGRVTEKGAPLAGVEVTLAGTHAVLGAQAGKATTGADGVYSFTAPAGGDYTVAPALANHTFAPASRSFDDLSSAQTADFEATLNRHAVSGRVAYANDAGLAGVTVTLSGGQAATATTDAQGAYSFANLPAGAAYTVTPALVHHTFAPASQSFDDLGADARAAFTAAVVNYRIAGRVTEKGAPLAGVEVTLAGTHAVLGAQAGKATTGADGAYSFTAPAGGDYTVAPSKKNSVFGPAAATFKGLAADQTSDFDASLQTVVSFAATSYTVGEGGGSLTVTVTREGDTTTGASAVYEGRSDTAKLGSDFVASVGLLTFAPGETSKTFTLFITDDAFAEGPERFTLTLTPSGSTVTGDVAVTSVTINDNDATTSPVNPLDDDEFFVRQHYRDFFSREPDAPGLKFWTDEIKKCGTDARCREARRVSVSAAFFLSIEFKETGYFAYRLYRASYGRAPARSGEFMLDSRVLGDGVVVGADGWAGRLAANRRAFLEAWTQRQAFKERFAGFTDWWFVETLFNNMNVTPTEARRQALLAKLGAGTSRAEVLAEVIEDEQFNKQEIDRAFVLMQYFGYLRRNPNDPPDSDLTGYNHWLGKLNEFGGDYEKAEMVKAFLSSTEYRGRFGN